MLKITLLRGMDELDRLPGNGSNEGQMSKAKIKGVSDVSQLPTTVLSKRSKYFQTVLPFPDERQCECGPKHINCLTAKEWLKCQLGVWEFYYGKEDVRDKKIHPATFPISLAEKVISLFSHEGEMVLDPFVGVGTSLLAAKKLNRHAVGFDLQKDYLNHCQQRLTSPELPGSTHQMAILDDAENIDQYFEENSIKLIWTSPPYANLLNRKRKNKS